MKSDIKNIINETLMDEVRRTILRESSAFNDGGEPMMTHNQFRDYSEPSYEEFDDYPYPDDNDNMNIQRDFINNIKSIGFYVETFDGREYFIRCKEHEDFMIYFPNDETIEIYDTKNNEQKQEFGYEDAVDYVLKNKDNLLTFDESIRERNREMIIDSQDRINNRAEMGGFNEEVKKGKDVYHITCEGVPIDSFESEDEANKHLNIYKDKHPKKEFIIEKQKYNSHSDMIDKLDEMGETFEEKKTKTMEKNPVKVKNLAQAILDAKEKGHSKIKVGTESYDVNEYYKQLEEKEMCDEYENMNEESDMGESNAFVLAADAAKDAGEKEFEFPKGSGKMHKVTIKADIDMKEGKSECSECGTMLNEEGQCNECSTMREEDDTIITSLDQIEEEDSIITSLDQLDESKKLTLRLTESELVSLISRMVSESVPGIEVTKRAQKTSGKDSKTHMSDVKDKLKKVSTFDGNNNPEFPNQITKGDKVAHRTTEGENETIEDNRGGGLEDLSYDYEPSKKFKIRLKKALEGDSTMGNSQNAANVIPSKTGTNISKKVERKAQKLAGEKQVSWGHRGIEPLNVKTVNESKTTMSSVLKEEVQRMKNILGYNEKTQ